MYYFSLLLTCCYVYCITIHSMDSCDGELPPASSRTHNSSLILESSTYFVLQYWMGIMAYQGTDSMPSAIDIHSNYCYFNQLLQYRLWRVCVCVHVYVCACMCVWVCVYACMCVCLCGVCVCVRVWCASIARWSGSPLHLLSAQLQCSTVQVVCWEPELMSRTRWPYVGQTHASNLQATTHQQTLAHQH